MYYFIIDYKGVFNLRLQCNYIYEGIGVGLIRSLSNLQKFGV